MDFPIAIAIATSLAFAGALQQNDCSPDSIPGTTLKTHTFYKPVLRSIPDAYFTFTSVGTPTWNYIQLDHDLPEVPDYEPGGKWYNDTLWEFIPSEENGWYGMRTFSRPNAYLTFLAEGFINPNNPSALHIIAEEGYPAQHNKVDFLWKPVAAPDAGHVYYQLKSKKYPKGVFSRSPKVYKRDSYYTQLDISGTVDHLEYELGGELYEETLFTFETPVVGPSPSELQKCSTM